MQFVLTDVQRCDSNLKATVAGMSRRCALALSMALIFVIPVEGALWISGVGRLSRVIGLLLAFVWGVSIVTSGCLRKPRMFHVLAFAFVLWNAITVFWTVDVNRTVERMKTYAQLSILTMILWDLYLTRCQVRNGLQIFVLGAFAGSIGTVFSFASNDSFYERRFATAGLHVDDLGIILALAIPMALYLTTESLARTPTGKWLRIANLLYLPLAVFAIFLTGTRGAIVALAPAIVYLFVCLLRSRPTVRARASVMLLVGLCAVVPLIPAASLTRISTIGPEIAHGDLNGRTQLWKKGIDAFSQRPIVGIGSYGYRKLLENRPPYLAHNSFISILVELGLIGFSLMAMVAGVLFVSLLRHPWAERFFWTAVMSAMLIGACGLSWEHRKPVWLLMSLLMCSAATGVVSNQADDTDETFGSSASGEI